MEAQREVGTLLMIRFEPLTPAVPEASCSPWTPRFRNLGNCVLLVRGGVPLPGGGAGLHGPSLRTSLPCSCVKILSTTTSEDVICSAVIHKLPGTVLAVDQTAEISTYQTTKVSIIKLVRKRK